MADEIRRLIRVRTQKGANFKRDGYGKKPQLSSSWRKPRGQHNKQREQKKAKGNLVKPGFGSPVAVRGMHPSGFFEVLVHSAQDLEGLDAKTQAVRIASGVGNRKRAAIQEAAITAGLRVLNARAAKSVKPSKKQVAPAAEDKAEKPKKVTAEKKAKPVAEKKKKEPAAVKEQPSEPAAPQKPKKAVKEPAEKEKPAAEKKKEPKQKAPKAKAEAAAPQKAKKAESKKAATPAKEAAAPKKAATKPAEKPKKKTSKEVKGNE